MKMSRPSCVAYILVLFGALLPAGSAGFDPEEDSTQRHRSSTLSIDDELEAEIRAVFEKHASAPLVEFDAARSRLRDALIHRAPPAQLHQASAGLEQSQAAVGAAKTAILDELRETGVSEELAQQEWSRWLEERSEAAKAKGEKQK
jgi:hypothetical protein